MKTYMITGKTREKNTATGSRRSRTSSWRAHTGRIRHQGADRAPAAPAAAPACPPGLMD